MKRLLFLTFLMGGIVTANAQCDFSDDFSSAAAWTQVGTNVEIGNGRVNYVNGAADGEQRRIHQSLGFTLNSNDSWEADIDFTPLMLGQWNGQPSAGHNVLSITAGTTEPFSDCPDIPCTSYPRGTQDGIMVVYLCNNPPNGNNYFRIYAKDSLSEYRSSGLIIANNLNSTYYLRAERVSATLTKLSVFADAARTMHLPGSPIYDTISADVSGLTHVQHGNVARGYQLRRLTGYLDNLCIKRNNVVSRNCHINDDYSNDSAWTQVGSDVEVVSGSVHFLNGAQDGTIQRRVYRSIGTSIDEHHIWQADVDFTPNQLGSWANQPATGHIPIALTETTQDPLNDCSDLPCSGKPWGTQDAVVVHYLTTNPPDGNTYFRIESRDDSMRYDSPRIMANGLNSTFYLRLERMSPTTVQLSVFSEPSRTMHIPGSPIIDTIPASLRGLKYFQHGNQVRGDSRRKLTAKVDNLCFNYKQVITSIEENAIDHPLKLYPNPVNDLLQIESPISASQQLFVYNVQGQLVTEHFFSGKQHQLDVSGFPKGVYVIRIMADQTLIEQKFVKY